MWPFGRKAEERAPRAEPPVQASAQPALRGPLDPHELALALAQANSVNEAGVTVTTQSAMRISAVFRCANLISGVCAQSKIQVKDAWTDTAVEKHQVARLLNLRPNRRQSAYEFRKWLTMRMIFGGEPAAKKVRSGGRVVGLIPLTGHVGIEERRDGSLLFKHSHTGNFKDAGSYEELRQEDVLHVRGLTLDGIRTSSVLSFARESVGLSQIMSSHGAKFFANHTAISGALEHPNKISPQAADRLKSDMDDFRAGEGDRAFSTILLEEGMTYKQFGMTASDAEFVENRKLSILDICIFFGVAPHLIGFTENQTSYGQGVQEQSRGFVNFGLTDWIGFWEGAITRDMLDPASDEVAQMDLQHLQRGNELERWQANEIRLRTGTHTRNDIRRKEGEPEIEGGNEFFAPPGAPAPTSAPQQPAGAAQE